MTIPSHVPEAYVINVTVDAVTIRCPYCDHQHAHTTPPFAERTDPQWRAPGCGLYRSADDRATGYRFTLPPRRTTTRRRNHE